MRTVYYSCDVDGNEVDFETELLYLQDEIDILSLLWNIGSEKGFSDAIRSHIPCILNSITDCINGINLGLSYVFLPTEEFKLLESLDPYVL